MKANMELPSDNTRISGMIWNRVTGFRRPVWEPLLPLREEALRKAETVRRSHVLVSLDKERMQKNYPDFQVLFETKWGIAWKGFVQPASKRYEILILYTPGCEFEDITIKRRPVSVFVTSGLSRREEEPDKRVPHLYASSQFPKLCLYHPTLDAWSYRTNYIADDIVFFASQWLLTYEFWHLTGEWVAPGAHPDNGDKTDVSISELEISTVADTGKFDELVYTVPLLQHMPHILPPLPVIKDTGSLDDELIEDRLRKRA